MRIVFARYRDLRVVRFAIRQELIANRFNFFFGKEHRSGFLGGSIEDVDLPEAGHRTAVADSVGLSRLAFAVISCPVQFVGSLSAQSVAGIPEIGRARLIRNIPKHLAELPILNLPKSLAAELEIVSLLIERPSSVSVDKNAIVDSAHQILKRNLFLRRLERYVWHAREGHTAPAIGMQTTIRLLVANERSKVTSRLPIHKNTILHQRPALRGHAFIVISDSRQTMWLDAVAIEIADFGAELEFARLVRREKARAGVIRFPQYRPIQLGQVADRFVNRQPQMRGMQEKNIFGRRDRLGAEFHNRLFTGFLSFLEP